MGKVMSVMTKPVKQFNIENRAHKVISREKPIPAPLHKSTHKQLEIAQATNPTFMEAHYKKDAELDDRLKNIYINTSDVQVAQDEIVSDRPLPVLTRRGEEFAYGFWTPKIISEGRCTLGTALEFMSQNLEDPIKNSNQTIAATHKLDIKDVEHMLEYYKILKVVLPEDRKYSYFEVLKIAQPKKKEEE